MYNWWRQRKHKKQTKDETHLHMAWEEDYHLQDPGRLALFEEYLEMSMFGWLCHDFHIARIICPLIFHFIHLPGLGIGDWLNNSAISANLDFCFSHFLCLFVGVVSVHTPSTYQF